MKQGTNNTSIAIDVAVTQVVPEVIGRVCLYCMTVCHFMHDKLLSVIQYCLMSRTLQNDSFSDTYINNTF